MRSAPSATPPGTQALRLGTSRRRRLVGPRGAARDLQLIRRRNDPARTGSARRSVVLAPRLDEVPLGEMSADQRGTGQIPATARPIPPDGRYRWPRHNGRGAGAVGRAHPGRCSRTCRIRSRSSVTQSSSQSGSRSPPRRSGRQSNPSKLWSSPRQPPGLSHGGLEVDGDPPIQGNGGVGARDDPGVNLTDPPQGGAQAGQGADLGNLLPQPPARVARAWVRPRRAR